jgi:hypothetical protein
VAHVSSVVVLHATRTYSTGMMSATLTMSMNCISRPLRDLEGNHELARARLVFDSVSHLKKPRDFFYF